MTYLPIRSAGFSHKRAQRKQKGGEGSLILGAIVKEISAKLKKSRFVILSEVEGSVHSLARKGYGTDPSTSLRIPKGERQTFAKVSLRFTLHGFPTPLFSLRSFVANRSRRRGFTLLEMMITLAIFVLLAAAVFGIMSGTLQSTSVLQDNQNRSDQIDALDAFLKKKLCEMPPAGQVASYRRGDGEGLVQNGIILGTAITATAIDAKVQANSFYTLRLVTYNSVEVNGVIPDARQSLVQLVTSDDPSLIWTPLITDVKTIDWKFLDFNMDLTQWVELWNNTTKPNLVEFSLQLGGDLQTTTMDFWVPKVDPITLNHTVPTPNVP